MNPERRAFLDRIEANPADPAVRGIFADWLDEHDEPEEADFFRRWTPAEHAAALERLAAYAAAFRRPYGAEHAARWGEEEQAPSLEQILEAAHDHLDRGESLFLLFDTPDVVHERREEFWRDFQTVTGRRLEDPRYGATFFHCAC